MDPRGQKTLTATLALVALSGLPTVPWYQCPPLFPGGVELQDFDVIPRRLVEIHNPTSISLFASGQASCVTSTRHNRRPSLRHVIQGRPKVQKFDDREASQTCPGRGRERTHRPERTLLG
ncbi:hypothetical protein IWZ01DRAFT_335577 [Phyllosticta capitalensis]|uniref:Secreted protein n=1 Tax=Phyllosticta capitalensis TaxID=121624 RepID=A0ABR1YH80_9PEZI